MNMNLYNCSCNSQTFLCSCYDPDSEAGSPNCHSDMLKFQFSNQTGDTNDTNVVNSTWRLCNSTYVEHVSRVMSPAFPIFQGLSATLYLLTLLAVVLILYLHNRGKTIRVTVVNIQFTIATVALLCKIPSHRVAHR